MTRLLLAILLLFLVPHDARANTPEEAFKEFTDFWRQCCANKAFWRQVTDEAEAVSDPFRSESFRQKRAEARAKARDMEDRTAFIWGEFDVTQKLPNGNCMMFITQLHVKSRLPNLYDQGFMEKEYKEPYSFVFEQVGDRWLLKELWRACTSCSGSGACAKCGGSGRAGTCGRCGGTGRCSRCGSKGLVMDSLTHNILASLGVLFLPGGDEFVPSTDRSTAAAAVKSYMDSWTQRELIRARKTMDWVNQELPKFWAMLTPTNAGAARRVLEMELEAARRRYQSITREITSVEEKGEYAYAQTVVGVEGVANKCGVLLQQGEGGWLVDAHLSQQCVWCAGKGQCPLCNGTGKMGEVECYNCHGRIACDHCKGFGWVEGE